MCRFTSIPDNELRAYLQKLRRIATLPDDTAIAETDEFIFNILKRKDLDGAGASTQTPDDTKLPTESADDDLEWERESAKSDISQFKREIADARRKIKAGRGLYDGDISYLLAEAASLGSDWSSNVIKKEYEAIIRELRQSANQLAADMQVGVSKQELQELVRELSVAERQLEKGQFDKYHINWFPQRLERLSEEMEAEVKAALEVEITDAREKCDRVVSSIAVAHSKRIVTASYKEILNSIATVRKQIRELREAEEVLSRNGELGSEIKTTLRTARERLAWFRANKKLTAAKAADPDFESKKAQRLLSEAKVLLSEDWESVFGDEQCPDVSSHCT